MEGRPWRAVAATLCYIPCPPLRRSASRGVSQCSARVALSSENHRRLRVLAMRRFGRRCSVSRLGSLVLDEYLSEMERAYFGASRARCCTPLAERDFDAVLFDMDGVLCDSEQASRLAGVATLAKLYGVECKSQEFEQFTGTGEARFLQGVAALHGVTPPQFDPEKAKEAFFEAYINDGFMFDVKVFPGVKDLLGRLKQLGMKVAVASAADAMKVQANLRAIGIAPDTFDFVSSSENITQKKPAPDVFLAAAKGVGVDPERCVVIEDAAAGIDAARAARMRCVAVATSLSREILEKHHPDVIREQPAFIRLEDIFGKALFPSSNGAPSRDGEESGRVGDATPDNGDVSGSGVGSASSKGERERNESI